MNRRLWLLGAMLVFLPLLHADVTDDAVKDSPSDDLSITGVPSGITKID